MKTFFNNLNVVHILSYFKAQKDAGKFKFGGNVYRDWKYILALFLVLNVLVVAGSAYLFFQINKGELFIVEKKSVLANDTVDRKALEVTVAFYEERAQKFDLYKRNPPRVADPSL